MAKSYAGIGSRETPPEIMALMTKIAVKLEKDGFTLRSGGAYGADTAFSKGCITKQIFVPWDGFNNLPLIYPIPQEAFTVARLFHHNWDRLTQGAQRLMARNTMQVLGPNLRDHSNFVICWTKDGCAHENERSAKTGGTGQAIAIASRYNIPVFNLVRPEHLSRFDFLK
jgi:hypothetical protein